MRSHTANSRVKSRTLAVATHYFNLSAGEDLATSISMKYTAGTTTSIVLQACNFDVSQYADDSTGAEWQDLPITFANISGAGGQFVSWGNVSAFRLRLKLVVTVQVTGFEMSPWGVGK